MRFFIKIIILLFLGSSRFAQAADPTTRPTDYAADMRALVKTMDDQYPFFDLKNIRDDWNAKKSQFIERSGKCENDNQFTMVVFDAIDALRDAHLDLKELRTPLPPVIEYYPDISFFPAEKNQVVICHAPEKLQKQLRIGVVVTKINGVNAREYLDNRAKEAWKIGGPFSSPQRARLFEYRIPFRDEKGKKQTIECIVDGKEIGFQLTCDTQAKGWPHTYNLPQGLTSVGRSGAYGVIENNIMYVYLRYVDSDVPKCLGEAAKTPGVNGWIIDLRGNGGGGYDDDLIDAVNKIPKNSVVIVDPGCFSAGEDLARDIQAITGAKIIGTTTAGSSSAKKTFVFPSGYGSLTYSVRGFVRNDGSPVEFNGIVPDIVVEPSPSDLLAGKNTEILRAAQMLKQDK